MNHRTTERSNNRTLFVLWVMWIERDITKATAIRPSVSAVIRDGRGRVLLGRRADNGQWGLPGGNVEIGESVTAAIVREAREETGLEVAVVRLVGVYSDPAWMVVRYPDGRVVHYVNTCFECRVTRGELATCSETTALAYFDPAALPEDTVPQHRLRIADAVSPSGGPFIR
jgi:ADP-ribose pyrophosphatase YjhB (NUDIX family)